MHNNREEIIISTGTQSHEDVFNFLNHHYPVHCYHQWLLEFHNLPVKFPHERVGVIGWSHFKTISGAKYSPNHAGPDILCATWETFLGGQQTNRLPIIIVISTLQIQPLPHVESSSKSWIVQFLFLHCCCYQKVPGPHSFPNPPLAVESKNSNTIQSQRRNQRRQRGG